MPNSTDTYYNVRVKLRTDSHYNWKSKEATFVPLGGEVIVYDILGDIEADFLNIKPVDFQMIKIGDGHNKLKDLPFINDFYPKEEIDKFLDNLKLYTDTELISLDGKIEKNNSTVNARIDEINNYIQIFSSETEKYLNSMVSILNIKDWDNLPKNVDERIDERVTDLKENFLDILETMDIPEIAITGEIADLKQTKEAEVIFNCNK